MRHLVLLSLLSAAAVAPLAASAQQNLPPYAQPDPSATHAAPVPDRTPPPEDPAMTARAKDWLHRAQTSDFDRSQLEPQMSSAITPDAAKQAAASLNTLGRPTSFTYVDTLAAGNGLKTYVYRVAFPKATLNWLFTVDGSGKIAGFYLHPESNDEGPNGAGPARQRPPAR